MLSISDQGKNSLVDDVLHLDILPRLKELLCTESGRNIKCECLWILINISVMNFEAYLNHRFMLFFFFLGRRSSTDKDDCGSWIDGPLA